MLLNLADVEESKYELLTDFILNTMVIVKSLSRNNLHLHFLRWQSFKENLQENLPKISISGGSSNITFNFNLKFNVDPQSV